MKVFKAIVDGIEYEIEMELVSDDGKEVKTTPAGMLRREPKKTAQKAVQTAAPAAAATAAAAAPEKKPEPAPQVQETPAAAAEGAGEAIVSPLPGNVFKVEVKNGDAVKMGQVLFIIEAMKMENEIMAPKDGVIGDVRVAVGQTVNPNDVLCMLQ